MGNIINLIEDELPGVYVYSLQLGTGPASDRWAGFFGNVNSQVDQVCQELAANEGLRGGFNAIGFSQGGLFLRAYIERCNNPPVRNLVTFGSPHAGVARLPACKDPNDWACALMHRMAHQGIYSWYVRDHIVPAQYFKDPDRLDLYFEKNIFLPDINNEVRVNQTYADNLASLERFIMVRFTKEDVVVPSISTWFGFVNELDDDIPLQFTELYTEDRLGLRQLDEQGRLLFLTNEGFHMQVSRDLLTNILHKYLKSTPVPPPRFRIQARE
ncbi:hypothetical protein EV182_000425 [Spiromyces aspiralis]|uniref:Uncharacterized protein n=1 Tax=Spiromyces aspiralis TaxID=68401 RepID=A0ACC1HYL7_9FUNG|nr:hypothetical protein EV182_000425 [Spiromyces aspiralis]